MFRRGRVTQATLQGRRRYQEDRIIHFPVILRDGTKGQCLAICDGHGGNTVSEHCFRRLPELFKPSSEESIELDLKNAVTSLDSETRSMECGSTLSIACIIDSKRLVVTATLGDSPIIILDVQSRLVVSNTHNIGTNIEERRRAIARGGVYDHNDGYLYKPGSEHGLMLSRALGDQDLDGVLDRTPEISWVQLGSYSFVMVCSDGVLDSSQLHTGDSVFANLVTMAADRYDAETILQARAQSDLADNASIVLWQRQPTGLIFPFFP